VFLVRSPSATAAASTATATTSSETAAATSSETAASDAGRAAVAELASLAGTSSGESTSPITGRWRDAAGRSDRPRSLCNARPVGAYVPGKLAGGATSTRSIAGANVRRQLARAGACSRPICADVAPQRVGARLGTWRPDVSNIRGHLGRAQTTASAVIAVGDVAIGVGHSTAKLRVVSPIVPAIADVVIAPPAAVYEGVSVVIEEVIIDVERRAVTPVGAPSPTVTAAAIKERSNGNTDPK
jgi:hypothetical protein